MSSEEQKDIHEIKTSLARIETGIFGDKKAGIEGIVSRVQSLEEYKKGDEKMKNTVAGALIVGTPALVFAWDVFKEWIKSFF